jgi:hypothetical protein
MPHSRRKAGLFLPGLPRVDSVVPEGAFLEAQWQARWASAEV